MSIRTINVKLKRLEGSLLSYPTGVPSISTSAVNLTNFPDTNTVLAYDAVTYANAVGFVTNNYTNTTSLQVNTLNDINAPPTIANNSTLVYDTTTNKYIVKQIDLDGGNF